LDKTTATKKKKTSPGVLPAFHSSQTQKSEVAAPSFNRSPSGPTGPLAKYEFFMSGVESSIEARIKKLGGRVITIDKRTAHQSKGRLFFLSEVRVLAIASNANTYLIEFFSLICSILLGVDQSMSLQRLWEFQCFITSGKSQLFSTMLLLGKR
jgi:hypothetical protein